MAGPCVSGLFTPSLMQFAVSPDSKALIVAGFFDNTIRMYALDTLQCIQQLVAHFAVTAVVVLEPKSSFMVTGSQDGTSCIWMWEAKAGRWRESPRHRLYGHDKAVLCAALSVTNDRAVTGSAVCVLCIFAYLQTVHRKRSDVC